MTHDGRIELIGQLIDVFEDFLEGRNVVLEHDSKNEDGMAAIINGVDYDVIACDLERTLVNWGLIAKE